MMKLFATDESEVQVKSPLDSALLPDKSGEVSGPTLSLEPDDETGLYY